jgi:Ca2+-transporting ATPase
VRVLCGVQNVDLSLRGVLRKETEEGIEMDFFLQSTEQASKTLDVNPETGLTESQAQARLVREGPNQLATQKKKRWILRFFAQFKDFSVIALIIAAAISAAAALMHGAGDYLDSIIIVAIVAANAIIGLIQEGRAEKALEALRKLSSPKADVLRGGRRVRVDAAKLVPGDIIFVETGDCVPADARLLEAAALSTHEAALTGESQPCGKNAAKTLPQNTPLAEQKNMILSSTLVLTGHGKALVTATGMRTQIGRIAGMLQTEKTPQTPLQKRLEKVGKQLGIGAMIISGLVFVLGLLQKEALLDSFMLAVSLAVAAIPEGLPAMVTVVLSLGVQRMAKHNAIIRRLPAVETLGCASVVCSDKTGTLTQNKMQVPLREGKRQGGAQNGLWTPEGTRIQEERMLRLAALCCNAAPDGKRGDPTETAIVEAARRLHLPVAQDRTRFARLHETPFDSNRKRMHVIVDFGSETDAPSQGKLMIVKGAPDLVLARCRATDAQKKAIATRHEAMAADALRVIAVAARPFTSGQNAADDNELNFLGLIGMYDPPRREAKAAVATCKRAGITPIMITGDHIVTATAIAREIGILQAADKNAAMTGVQIDALDDDALGAALERVRVFARVTPAHKLRIVKLLRGRAQVVAMTGDGVNDAPALKAADIGCAMGRGGTEVAKGASDMILTDDNFASIIHAVEEGRGIYDNIKKAVHFLISSNIGEVAAVFFAALLRFPPILLPIQLLWVNVVTDSAPAIALGMERPDKHIMQRPPKSVTENFFSGALAFHMTVEGLLMGSVTLLAFVLGYVVLGAHMDLMLGQTMAFSVLSFVEIAHANNQRSARPLLAVGLFSNKNMNFANALCIGLQAAVVTIPALRPIFGTVALNTRQWLAVCALSVLPTVLLECEKLISAISRRRQARLNRGVEAISSRSTPGA